MGTAAAVPGKGSFPTAPSPDDNAAGKVVMAANIQEVLDTKNRGAGWAERAHDILAQALTWAGTQV